MTPREADGDGEAPGAVARFPYDRMTVERFRDAFPGARWRDELGAWFVPGVTAERRLQSWAGREWSGVLSYADQRGRDDFTLEPITSAYLEAGEELLVRTPYSKAVIAELRGVPWSRWDRENKAWRVPFRSVGELRKRWPAIEEAARRAEPAARRDRAERRKGTAEEGERRADAGEKRRHRHPVPADAPPPLERVLMTGQGCVMFTAVTGELVEPEVAERFYPGVAGAAGGLIWADWRRPSHDELVRAWPARDEPAAAETARGWWRPTIAVLREERREAAARERALATRREKAEGGG
ncbi:MAG: hypothetical protein INR71_01095 [Terriglobus roseus]|nr:hypothetical protein [Terriglobus roseus]